MKKILSLFALLFALTLSSCDKDSSSGETQEEELPTGDVVLSVDRSRIFNTGVDQATLTVMCGEVDVTDNSTFYCVGAGAAMESNVFTSTVDGKYEFYANYNNSNTNKVSLAVGGAVEDFPADPDEANTAFESTMLMLQFTGAECGYCQDMIYAIEELEKNEELSSKVEHVAIHSYYGNGADVLYSVSSVQLSQAMGVAYYPTVMFNMDSALSTNNNGSLDANYDALYTLITKNYNDSPAVGICAASSIENGVLSANVEVKAAQEGDYNVGMLLIENGVYGYQYGFTDDIEHVNAFRASADRTSAYDFSGTWLGEISKGESRSTILDMTLDQTAWDLDNCHILIYVTAPNDSGDYIIQNVVRCEVGGSIEYQYVN
ncbi:MAG: Omp28-related outer membrane protein [Rikenellaceae bacterium]